MIQDALYKTYIKRFLDLLLSLIALIFLSPFLLIVIILVRIKIGSPVVFKQARPGKGEKIFYLYKFRTMTNERDAYGRLLSDADRLTKFGKFLRSTSIDELLELINIINGDMSIVGPRPLSIYYLPHYPDFIRIRHDVRPGLTGLAQINGRNNLPWNERFEMDIDYVKHISLTGDLKIIIGTINKVLKRSDISVRGTTRVKDYGPYKILHEEGNMIVKECLEMTYSEIGSYFWLDGSELVNNTNEEKTITWLPPVEDSSFTFSGRSAIGIALQDILQKRTIKKVYVPSYSCVSMLQAFIDRGIEIKFYQVVFQDGKFIYEIPDVDRNAIVLIMSYFGLDCEEERKIIDIIHDKGAVVIEDITHSLLKNECSSAKSDYLVASLRKWFAVPTGGWIGKINGEICCKPSIDGNDAVKEKIAGMLEKHDYLSGKITSKENFLLAQAKFDNDLIHIDQMLEIDSTSLRILRNINIDDVIHRRRLNADILIKGLTDLNCKVLQVPSIDFSIDVPFFVPIFLENSLRNSLRDYLIRKGVYCPVHWPEVMGAPKGVRENELSLICDQRYSETDMQAIVKLIHEWHNMANQKSSC